MPTSRRRKEGRANRRRRQRRANQERTTSSVEPTTIPASSLPSGPSCWFPSTLARFFIPLAQPLPTFDGYTYVLTTPVTPRQHRNFIEEGKAVRLEASELLRIAGLAPPEIDRDHETPLEPSPGQTVEGLDAPMLFSERAFVSYIRLMRQSVKAPIAPSFNASVLALNRSYREETGNVAPRPRGSALSTSLDFTVAEVVVQGPPDEVSSETIVQDALPRAISLIQHTERSFYMVRRYPFHLTSIESLPFQLLVATGSVCADATTSLFPVHEWIPHSVEIHMTPWSQLRTSELTQGEYVALDQAFWQDSDAAPYYAHSDLRREAIAALHRDGNYRSCVVWAAAATEDLFDEVLKHMLWEENARPERCIGLFRPPLLDRLSQHYRPRLPSWDLHEVGPLREWLTRVAWVRNRVVHAMYKPSREEAEAAISALDQLVTHIGDLLVSDLAKYPRTAFTLLGREGLARRNSMTPALEALSTSTTERSWRRTFARWRSTHGLLLRDDRLEKRVPDLTNAQVFLVYRRDGLGYWCAVDNDTGQAVKVAVDLSGVGQHLIPGIERQMSQGQSGSDVEPWSMAFINEQPPIARILPPWREKYHFIPGYGVLCTEADISDRLFDWNLTTHHY